MLNTDSSIPLSLHSEALLQREVCVSWMAFNAIFLLLGSRMSFLKTPLQDTHCNLEPAPLRSCLLPRFSPSRFFLSPQNGTGMFFVMPFLSPGVAVSCIRCAGEGEDGGYPSILRKASTPPPLPDARVTVRTAPPVCLIHCSSVFQ